MTDYASEHTMFNAMLLEQCGIHAPIIRNGSTPWRVIDGVGIAPTYRVECPTGADIGIAMSWDIPVGRENGQALLPAEVKSFRVRLNGCEVSVATCDTNGVCGPYSEPVDRCE